MAFVCDGCGEEIEYVKKKGPARRWCSERCRKTKYAGECKKCGAPTTGCNGRAAAPEICDSCFKGRNADRNAALVAMWEAGANSREVAERFGMDESAVGSFLNSLRQRGVNVPMHTLPHRDYEERYRQIVELAAAGCTNKEIAAEIGSTRGSVVHMIYVARRKGFEIPARR